MPARALIALVIVLMTGAALAQSIGGMSGIGPRIGGAGGSGGGGGGGCANTLTLDYSNTCNIIGGAASGALG